METLTITEILEFYDVPQLFWAKDNENAPYLCLCYDIDKGGNLLCIAAKQPNHSKDLVNILKNAEVRHSLYTVKMLDDDNIVAQPYTGGLMENMLPKGVKVGASFGSSKFLGQIGQKN